MADDIERLSDTPGAPALVRRRIAKPDGRDLLLYGASPPDGAVTGENLEGGPRISELRWHPLRREWAVYASGRQDRTFKPSAAADPLAPATPDGPATEIPVAAFEIAVFENRFPSFSTRGPDDLAAPPRAAPSFGVRTLPAIGKCEVVVYTSAPTGDLGSLGADRLVALTRVWIDRYRELYDAGAQFVLPFENRGEEVGVTLLHPHGQIYAFPVTPAAQAQAAASFAEGYDLAAGIAAWAPEYGVAEAGGVQAFAPPFARFPYEIWVAPRSRRRGPWEMSLEEIEGFAFLLGEVTRRYDRFFRRPCPYMLTLHAAPSDAPAGWHFTAQFYPLLRAPDKLKYLASVEQATGLFTVDVAPETAAKALRAS